MQDLEKIKLDLKRNLSSYRYEHSVRVAMEAVRLAKCYGVCENDAYLAGLLHDVAKEFSLEENRWWVYHYDLSRNLLDKDNIKTCHAQIGAVVAKELYGVNDKICQAICYHTVGNIHMNGLDKIVFVADKIESGKDYPGIEEERILAYKNIEEALILCLENNKNKLEKEGRLFNQESLEVLEYFLSKRAVH